MSLNFNFLQLKLQSYAQTASYFLGLPLAPDHSSVCWNYGCEPSSHLFNFFLQWELFYDFNEISSVGSGIWTLGSKLVVLFEEAMDRFSLTGWIVSMWGRIWQPLSLPYFHLCSLFLFTVEDASSHPPLASAIPVTCCYFFPPWWNSIPLKL